MVETLLVFGTVGLLVLLTTVAPLLPPEALLEIGALVVAAGLLLGLPTGLAYHVVLYRRLRARGRLPARWWLRPVALHPLLAAADRADVQRWFVAGGVGFGVVVVGLVLGVAGLVAPWLATAA